MRVIGIDPGTRTTGYGIVEKKGNRLFLVKSGFISPPQKCTLPQKLKEIYEGILDVIDETRPEAAAVEGLYFHKDASSALKLGHARGAILIAFAQRKIEVYEYTPLTIRSSVVGYGKADKVQLSKMVKALIGSFGSASLDASDALAVAICHLNRHRENVRYSKY